MAATSGFAELRRQFPVTEKMTYLDAAHQTPLSLPVRAALEGFLDEGMQQAGPKQVWLSRIEKVRERMARFLGAAASELAFTKNTSEGMNIAANSVDFRAGDNVLMIEGDHPNNAYAWLNLARKGVEVRFIRIPSDGVADAGVFEPHIDARTRVISLSHVSFHAGQRHDLASIGALCRKHDILLVVDAMQSAGVVPIDVKAAGISILAAGCHKGLLIPQGLGLLYVDRARIGELHPAYLALAGLAHPPADLVADPRDLAPRDDAGRFELGNFNLPAIHALDGALALIEQAGVSDIESHVLALGDCLLGALDEIGVGLVGPRRRDWRAHIYVLKIPSEYLQGLTERNIRVSPERDGIRISFGLFNDERDVRKAVQALKDLRT